MIFFFQTNDSADSACQDSLHVLMWISMFTQLKIILKILLLHLFSILSINYCIV